MSYVRKSQRFVGSLGQESTPCSEEAKHAVRGKMIPVFPGKVNSWLIAYVGPRLSSSQLRKHIEYLFRDVWFSSSGAAKAIEGVKVSFAQPIRILSLTSEDMHDQFGKESPVEKYRGLTASILGTALWSQGNLNSFGIDPHIADHPSTETMNWSFVEVQFVYHGKSTSYFNPTYAGTPMGGKQDDWDCAANVNTWVDSVYAPKDFVPCDWVDRDPSTGSALNKIYVNELEFVTSDSPQCGGRKGEDRGSLSWLALAGLASAGAVVWYLRKRHLRGGKKND